MVKIKYKSIIGTIVGTTILFLLAGSASALSNDGGGNWSYYRDITINNSGSNLSDYQILLNLSGAGFPVNANASGADLRFTGAGGAEFAYWVEGWDYANRSGRVWVNVTGVPMGMSTVRMWYGNPNAGEVSDGEKTFEFFDDFAGLNLDTNKWMPFNTGQSGSVYLSGGNLVIQGGDNYNT